MEFFIAENFHENIKTSLKNGLDYLKDFRKSKVIYEFLLEMLTKDNINFLKNDITPDKTEEEKTDYDLLMRNRGIEYYYEANTYETPESLGNCVYLLVNSGMKNMDNIQAYGATLQGVEFKDISFCNANLAGVNFENCKLINVKFNNASLQGASFRYAELENVDFTGANLDKADFRDINSGISTFETICKGHPWGTGKFNDDVRKRVEMLYKK